MITQISIRNFQRNRKLDVVLKHRITTITGETNRGKSAILRALIWVLTNTPDGKKFISHGRPGARVTLQIGKHELTRKRGAGKNEYVLDGKTFKAFGAKVPEEIAAFLRVSEINIQQQHDRSFWFHLSPPEVSRRLNAIIDLGLIDEAQQRISSTVKKARSETEFTRQRLEDAQAAVKAVAHAVDFAEDARRLDSLAADAETQQLSCERLENFITNLVILKRSIQAKEELPDFTHIDAMLAEHKQLGRQIENLQLMTATAKQHEETAALYSKEYEILHKRLQSISGIVCQTCGQPIKP